MRLSTAHADRCALCGCAAPEPQVYEPGGRYTAEQAIAHPFFEEYHDPGDEPVATHPFDNTCEGWNLDAAQWKAKVAEEVARFNNRTS